MKKVICIKRGILAFCFGMLLSEAGQAVNITVQEKVYSCLYGQWKCNDGRKSLLETQSLQKYFDQLTEKNGCLKKLGELILAQFPNHSLPSVLKNLIDHMFDRGHIGYYPYAQKIGRKEAVVSLNPTTDPRGIFNISGEILTRIAKEIRKFYAQNWQNFSPLLILKGFHYPHGYAVDPLTTEGSQMTLRMAAESLVANLFSSNTFDDIQIGLVSDERFNIYATYNGGPIQGIDYTHPTVLPLPPTNCLGLQSNGTPTNRICLVVGVYSGRIYIASLYPIG